MEATMLDVEAVNLVGRTALLTDGQTVSVLAMWDGDGDLTADPAEAVAFVAGCELTGWFAAPTSAFRQEATH
jgi:hypothetical protein